MGKKKSRAGDLVQSTVICTEFPFTAVRFFFGGGDCSDQIGEKKNQVSAQYHAINTNRLTMQNQL